jgi:hypothetical protein
MQSTREFINSLSDTETKEVSSMLREMGKMVKSHLDLTEGVSLEVFSAFHRAQDLKKRTLPILEGASSKRVEDAFRTLVAGVLLERLSVDKAEPTP